MDNVWWLTAGARPSPDLEIERRAKERPAGNLPASAAAALLAWNRERGAPPDLEADVEALVRGSGFAIVTGQQPAILGGPLYTLYKLLSACALARTLSRRLGRPGVAVFWCVGDDSDMGEVTGTGLYNSTGKLHWLRDSAPAPRGQMVGRLPAARQEEAARFAVETAARAEFHHWASATLDVVRAPGADWSDVLATLLFRLLASERFLFVEGSHPELLRAASPWLGAALESLPLPALLADGAERARAAGHAPALAEELGERAAFRVQGNLRLPFETPRVSGDELLAPNVVLRPLLQDFLFPNLITVCGPAEIRYRAQLQPVYEALRIPEPILWPRFEATFLPAGLEASERIRAVEDPDALLEACLTAERPVVLEAAVETTRARLRSELELLGQDLGRFDPNLAEVQRSAIAKIDFQMQRILDGLESKSRQRLYRRRRFLSHLKEVVRPREKPQERVVSFLWPFLIDGPEVAHRLRRAAETQVETLLDGGSARHAILELERFGEEVKGGE